MRGMRYARVKHGLMDSLGIAAAGIEVWLKQRWDVFMANDTTHQGGGGSSGSLKADDELAAPSLSLSVRGKPPLHPALVRINPLKGLRPLQKLHHSNPIPLLYLNTSDPGYIDGVVPSPRASPLNTTSITQPISNIQIVFASEYLD